jgi:hypothetical protein
MANINLEDAITLASADEFWAIRGKAIQAYASLEQSLSSLFATLAETDAQTANIIFFRIHSSDARNKIIEKLFQKKFKSQYNLFRNSLIKQLGPIDRERNEVVHWNVLNRVGSDKDGKATSQLELIPPANWIFDSNMPRKTSADLVAFLHKCDFYTRIINCLQAFVGRDTKAPDAAIDDMARMFEEAIVYPPPSGHLLYGFEQVRAIGPTYFAIDG